MIEKEKAIREQRTNQAAKKNIMGATGKLGTIARYLGSPILRQGSGLFSQSFIPDVYEQPEDEGMPTFDNEDIVCEGYVFDGLSRAMHIEIVYLDANSTLTVDYKGYRVYTEQAGDLMCYAPFPEWETMIDKLYSQSLQKQKTSKAKANADAYAEMKKDQLTFLQNLRLRWGI